MNTTTISSPRLSASHGRSQFWQRLWAALEAHGRRRAAAELTRLDAMHISADASFSQQVRTIAQRLSQE